MGNKLQKEKLEREAAARQNGQGGAVDGASTAVAPATSAPKGSVPPPTSDEDYANYNNKLTINDFALLKVCYFIQYPSAQHS